MDELRHRRGTTKVGIGELSNQTVAISPNTVSKDKESGV